MIDRGRTLRKLAKRRAPLTVSRVLLERAVKRLNPNYGKDFPFQVGRFKINLPYGHNLPMYREKCPQYDKFLPHLAMYLPNDSFVVDVGANCADTVASMIDGNTSLNFLCIEADAFTYQYLTANVYTIRKLLPEARIKMVKCLAGSEITDVVMAGTGGTKRATFPRGQGATTIQSVPLDSIIDSEAIPYSSVSLVKVDTDGYDYDVINSANSLLTAQLPLLFFECQYFDENQMKNYCSLIEDLAKKNYTCWTAFDNYGAVLLRSGTKNHVLELIDYVWRQNIGRSHRTIHYLDVFAGTIKDAGIMIRALDAY